MPRLQNFSPIGLSVAELDMAQADTRDKVHDLLCHAFGTFPDELLHHVSNYSPKGQIGYGVYNAPHPGVPVQLQQCPSSKFFGELRLAIEIHRPQAGAANRTEIIALVR